MRSPVGIKQVFSFIAMPRASRARRHIADIGFIAAAVSLLSVAFSTSAGAALEPRLGGTMYYDTVLNITWMADPNAIAGTAYDDGVFSDDGKVSWVNALAWADSLDFGGYDDWRLPTVRPLNGDHWVLTAPLAYDGSKDRGYNIAAPGSAYPNSPASELAYMFHVNLGNKGYYDLAGNPQSGWGLTNRGPFSTLEAQIYWTGVVYPLPDRAFRFGFDYGVQLGDITTQSSNIFHAWAVRDGDVTAVPEPGSLGLVAVAVASLAWVRRRGKSRLCGDQGPQGVRCHQGQRNSPPSSTSLSSPSGTP